MVTVRGPQRTHSPMAKIKSVVFDLDGTLLDSLGDIADAANEVLQLRGFRPHDHEAYRYFVGDGVAALFERALPDGRAEEARVNQCIADFKTVYSHRMNRHSCPYDGIPQLLAELVEDGIELAVLSNKPHEATLRCVDHFFGGLPFHMVLGQRDGIPRKPDPAGANEIKISLDLPGEACCFLGDTAIDMQTAVAAEMIPIGVSWGFRPREELIEHGAVRVIDRPGELLTLVELG